MNAADVSMNMDLPGAQRDCNRLPFGGRSSKRFVYIIEASNGLYKIGVSYNPESRVRSVNLYSPIPARLVAMWEGTPRDELDLHQRFDAQRGHNEWFRCDGAVAEFIAANRGRGVPLIKSWDEMAKPGRERAKADRRARSSAAAKAHWALRKARLGAQA